MEGLILLFTNFSDIIHRTAFTNWHDSAVSGAVSFRNVNVWGVPAIPKGPGLMLGTYHEQLPELTRESPGGARAPG